MIPSLSSPFFLSRLPLSLSLSVFGPLSLPLPRQFPFTPNRILGITPCSTPISSMCEKEKEKGRMEEDRTVCVCDV